jgi:hypothetical protein
MPPKPKRVELSVEEVLEWMSLSQAQRSAFDTSTYTIRETTWMQAIVMRALLDISENLLDPTLYPVEGNETPLVGLLFAGEQSFFFVDEHGNHVKGEG